MNEDHPWERLRLLKMYIKKTPLQMLLRGQSLVGYRRYADDVAAEFARRSVDGALIAVPENQERATGLGKEKLCPVAGHFRGVRKELKW